MALYKEITDYRGNKCLYHRISEVTSNGNCIHVNVKSYSSKQYRDKEIWFLNYSQKREEMLEELQTLHDSWHSNNSIENAEELVAKEKQFYEYQKEYNKILYSEFSISFALFSTNVDVPHIIGEEITFKNIYEYLKTVEPFIGATDV